MRTTRRLGINRIEVGVRLSMMGVALLAIPAASTAPPTSEPAATAVDVAAGEPWIAAQPHRQHLVLLRPDGTDAVDILTDLPFEQFHPDWSPDGSRLAFEHAPEGPDAAVRDVWISDADGANAEPLVDSYPSGLEGLFWSNPAWSADGAAVAMIGYEGNASMVLPTRSVFATVDVASGDISVVDESPQTTGLLHSNPRWSPDGNRFVLTLDHFDGDEYLGGAIAVIERAGTGWSEPTLITEVGEWADHPDWHPADDLIVFCTYDYGVFFETDEPSNLFTIRPDGTERVQITSFGAGEERATQPTWTHDGRIIFTYVSGAGDGQQQPAFINVDGTGLEVLTGPENLVYPRLRPTGSQ